VAERRRATRRTALVLATAVALVVAAALTAVALTRTTDADRFVTRSGSTLQVDGREFRFVGFNLYDAAASDIYSCEPRTRLDDAALDAAMTQVADAGGTVVRFWAYQTYTAGGTDWSGVDRVIDAARDHGLRVLPALEDGPGNCSTGPPGERLTDLPGESWYAEGYRQPLGRAALSYRDYVARITHHYRDEPTILGWSLMNEAETTARDADGRSVLVDFARDVSAVAHEADPHHLVTLGTQSNGAPGASGPDFTAVYSLPGLDFAEVHDWAVWGSDTEAMPGAEPDGSLPGPDQCQDLHADIACSFAAARALGKPLVVGEAGITARSQDARRTRAELLAPKIEAAFRAGASGYLLWQLNGTNTDGYAFIVGSDDPTFTVLRDAARRWAEG